MTAADRASRGNPSDATPPLGSLAGRGSDATRSRVSSAGAATEPSLTVARDAGASDRRPDGRPSREPHDGRAPDGTPLYVHLPFCAAKCHYCDFFSVPAEGHDRDRMIAAILREAEARAP